MRLIHTIDLDHSRDTKMVIKCCKLKDRQYIGHKRTTIKTSYNRLISPRIRHGICCGCRGVGTGTRGIINTNSPVHSYAPVVTLVEQVLFTLPKHICYPRLTLFPVVVVLLDL
jgi:hypothetical protein